MVLTRRQRKSGINVTPTQVTEKKDTTKKKRRTKEEKPSSDDVVPAPQEEDNIVSDVPSSIEEGGQNTPGKDSVVKKSRRVVTDVRETPAKTRGKEKSDKGSLRKNTSENGNISDDSTEEDTSVTDTRNSILHELSQSDDEMGVGDASNSDDEVGTASEGVRGQPLVEDSSDDDDAPESMTFGVARETALETLHQAYKESLKIKSKKKEKRRAHDTMMKEQANKKVRRCEQLDSNRLPETFLKHVNKETSDSKKPEPETDEIDGSDEDFFDDEDELFKEEGEDDYVIEKEGFQIVPLHKFAKIPVVKSMAASNFRQEQLYGKRIPRITAHSHISMSLKRSSKPAMNFKVKGLAVTKKERRKKKNNWINLIK